MCTFPEQIIEDRDHEDRHVHRRDENTSSVSRDLRLTQALDKQDKRLNGSRSEHEYPVLVAEIIVIKYCILCKSLRA